MNEGVNTGSKHALPETLRHFAAVESAGIFAGVRFFDDPELTEVAFAVDDAVDLAHLFTFDLALLPPEKVVLALEGEPQKESSQLALRRLLGGGAKKVPGTAASILRQVGLQTLLTGSNGIYIFTFAGHGLTDQGEDLLVTQELLKRRPVTTGLRLSVLMQDICTSRAPRRLVLVDACRANSQAARTVDRLSVPMSPSFHQALLARRGLTVLAGTTKGGFAYDDRDRCNGVFTGAVIDVLRGKEPSVAAGLYITVGDLAQAADRRVRDWVRIHRPHHEETSLGISCIFDPESMRDLPLASIPDRQNALEAFTERRNQALKRLRGMLEKPLTGAVFDRIEAQLEMVCPNPNAEKLIEGIERLDDSLYSRESLLALLERLEGLSTSLPETSRGFRRLARKLTLTLVAAIFGILVYGMYDDMAESDSTASTESVANLGVAKSETDPDAVKKKPTELEKPEPESPPLRTETRTAAPPNGKQEVKPSEDSPSVTTPRAPSASRTTAVPLPASESVPAQYEVKIESGYTDPGEATKSTSAINRHGTDMPAPLPTFKMVRVLPSKISGQTTEGSPVELANFSATVAVHYSTELGMEIVTVLWASEGRALEKRPVYQPGASLVLDSARGKIRFDVLAIDRNAKKINWSASLIPKKLDCSTKTDSLSQSPRFWSTPVGRYGVDPLGLHIELNAPYTMDKRCLDCRVKADTYKISAKVHGDNKAAAYGLYLLDMSEVRGEMYSLEISSGGRIAAIRHYVDGRATTTLWSGQLDTSGEVRLEVEARAGLLTAWADGRQLGVAQYDTKSVPNVALGSGFFLKAEEDLPVSAVFADYQLTTCIDEGGYLE